MSGYLKNVTVTETFDGDAVTIVLRPLRLMDMLKIRSALPTGKQVGPEAEAALLTAFQEVLPSRVVSITGLNAADGGEVTAEEMVTAAYFIPLQMACGTELMLASTPKNVPPPSVP